MAISSFSRSDHWERCVGAAGWRTQAQSCTPVPYWKPSHMVPGSSVILCCLHFCAFPYLLALQESSDLLARFLGTPGSFHWKKQTWNSRSGHRCVGCYWDFATSGVLDGQGQEIHDSCMHACRYVCMYTNLCAYFPFSFCSSCHSPPLPSFHFPPLSYSPSFPSSSFPSFSLLFILVLGTKPRILLGKSSITEPPSHPKSSELSHQ